MVNKALEDNYSRFILNLTTAIRKLSLYPPKHPAVIYSIKNIHSALMEILSTKNALSLSLSQDNKILIDGQPFSDKSLRLIEDLTSYFKRLDIENLTFNSGITEKEIEAFIRIMLLSPGEIKKLGDINKVFLDKDIQHIKIAQFSYIKVEKGKDDTLWEYRKVRDKLKSKIKDYCQGKVENLQDIQSIEKEIFDIISGEIKEKKRLSSSLKNIFEKFLLYSKEREDTLLRLKNALLDSGCLPQDVNNLVSRIQEEISEKPKIKSEILSTQEVERLKRENEELKSQLNQTEKQSKRIFDEKERIDNIIHYMAEGLVVVDSQGNILLVNPIAEKLLGIKKDETIGRPLKEVIKDEHLLTLVKNLTPDKEGVIQKDIELFSPDESTRRVLRTSSAVVEDHNGKTMGMVTILNDITRQKEIEKLKSDFLANVSHELRTPLATIQQNISLLMEELPGGLNEEQKKFLNIAQDNIVRLRRLINDLLDSAAIEAGKFKLKFSNADINETINKVIAFLGRWAEEKKITVQVNLLPEKELIEMDKDKIEQVLVNLLSNAIKFTPEGGNVYISAFRRQPTEEFPQEALEISVKDSGVGINPADIEKIFERFQRASAVDSGVGGAGLGLSICKEIVKLHGGRIWAESKLNEGSEFSFLLPKGR